jgi:hypothetical protein
MRMTEFIEFWRGASDAEKREFVEDQYVMCFKRGENSWSPKHPIFGTPSHETYATEHDAAIVQLDWLEEMCK